MNKHSELELKWDAQHVNARKFASWIMGAFTVAKAEVFDGTDFYYRRDRSVFRYRIDHAGGWQELTTKQRKSADSIRDRVEVNIKLGPQTTKEDVGALAATLDFNLEVALRKNSHVFHIPFGSLMLVVALYDVEVVDGDGMREQSMPVRTFLEAEVEFREGASQQAAEDLLEVVREKFTAEMLLEAPLNESLYEMYTGKLYEMAKAT